MFVKPKKHLGQHFLTDPSIAHKIAQTLSYSGYQQVVEIGPGTGLLTKHILSKNYKTTVFEIDKESIAFLKADFVKENIQLDITENNFEILGFDFLKFNLQNHFGNQQFAVIGNYPYNISSQIVFKILENRKWIPEFSGMFQKEVAERIASKEGSKIYGILSVLTQVFYDVEYLFTVPPKVFNPPPKVDSGVIKCVRKETFTLPVDEKLFFRVVKMAFNQRRKMLRSSLKSFQIDESTKLDPIFAKRPEQLSVNEFIQLTQIIAQNGI